MSAHIHSQSITVNGTSRSVDTGETLLGLIHALGLKEELVAVELNRQIVRRDRFSQERLHEGDRVEIVEFVGGG